MNPSGEDPNAPLNLTIRPFRDTDRPAVLDIRNRILPEHPITAEIHAYYDGTWDASRYTRIRLVAESAGQVVGWGQIQHLPWRFHPHKYDLRLEVDPNLWRRGIGGALYDRLLAEARARHAEAVRAETQESRAASVHFLTKRGYREVQRAWSSVLDVERFDFALFASAEPRVTGQGISITTLAAEGANDPEVTRPVYEMFIRCEEGEPSIDPSTPLPYDEFMVHELGGPEAIPEAMFLALDGQRFVGYSALTSISALPDTVDTGFTGVIPEYRCRGIALALKLRAIQYAREHGYQSIRTDNNSLNAPMLRINQALGFEREPAWITFEKVP
jgi:GNAT superfamily N-acetyltransferase